MKRRAIVAMSISVLLLLAAWGAGWQPATEAFAAGRGAVTVRLRVMTLNIFYGGDEINLTSGNWCTHPEGCLETLEEVIKTIRAANADVIGLEEAERNTRVIAERLGWHHSERMQIISRFPLIDPPGGDSIYIFVEVAPGKIAALANVHLPADPYGPYEVRDGASLEEVLALERSLRLPAIQDQIRVLPGLAARGIPVFLTGDFNTPSHLDWTKEVAAVRDVVRYPVDWPVGVAVAEAGFRDSYREVHPDPVARPGFTWTPGGLESIPNEVHDRIDWVLAAGPARAVASQILGEVGGPDVDIAVDPYPTDHRGVVSTFEVQAADLPVLVAVEARRLSVGDDLAVRFHSPGRRNERVALVPAGGRASDAVAIAPTGPGSPTDGRLVFSTAGFEPAAYEAALVSARGAILSRSPFWVYAPGAPTTVATSNSVYAIGEPIEVSWTNAPGMRWDWLGIYSPGESDENPIATRCETYNCGGNGRYLLYEYTRASIEGTTSFTEDSFVGWGTWPLQPGNYEIRLLLDDGYRSVASSAPFKVVLQ